MTNTQQKELESNTAKEFQHYKPQPNTIAGDWGIYHFESPNTIGKLIISFEDRHQAGEICKTLNQKSRV